MNIMIKICRIMPGPVMDYEIFYIIFSLITISIFIAILLFYYVSLHSHRSKTQKIDEVLSNAGYSYDHAQDIFYSRKDAWQKGFGYSQIYDEAAAPMGMIIDCEPVRFYYGGKKWLLEHEAKYAAGVQTLFWNYTFGFFNTHQ